MTWPLFCEIFTLAVIAYFACRAAYLSGYHGYMALMVAVFAVEVLILTSLLLDEADELKAAVEAAYPKEKT